MAFLSASTGPSASTGLSASTGPAPIKAAQRTAELTGLLAPAGRPARVATGDVIAILRAHGEPESIEITGADVTAMAPVAARLHDVFAAADVAVAARLLNDLLAQAAGPPRLSCHDGTAWHLHVDAADDTPWPQWFAASSAAALATLLATRQGLPGGICAAPGCGLPFVNAGGGSPRRYCSARCATRERVAAYRRGLAGP